MRTLSNASGLYQGLLMDAPFLFVDEVDTAGRRCLVRLDLNVPLADGEAILRVSPGDTSVPEGLAALSGLEGGVFGDLEPQVRW